MKAHEARIQPMVESSASDRAVLHPPGVQSASMGSTLFAQAVESKPAVTIDDIDRALLEYLLIDGKTTNRELAQRIGISESAVSIRLRKLISSGVLIFTALIDWEVAGFEWFLICRIKARVRSPQHVAADVRQLQQCEAVAVVLGSHDVLGYFLAKDRAELHDVVNNLAAVKGVGEVSVDLATETAVNRQGRQFFLARSVPPIRLPAPRIDLDDLDISILQALIDDGRQSSRKIARTLSVSEGTVRARIGRLNQAGLARVVAMVEPLGLGIAGVIASISIRAERTRLTSIVKEFMAMPNVVFAAVCVGNWDLNITMIATDPAQLMDLVGTQVQAVDGVLETDTLLMVDVVRFSPYMKRLEPIG